MSYRTLLDEIERTRKLMERMADGGVHDSRTSIYLSRLLTELERRS